MARAGLCSRRDAESWILDGRVSVNGKTLTSPAIDVGPDDVVLVDDAPLPTLEKTRLFLFHKPRGIVTSDHDPEGRRTVADFLRDTWPDGPRTVTIGRLDINTEGLLLLTNDGGLARTLELPKTGWVRRYRVRAKGETDQSVLDTLSRGVTVDGVTYAGIEATFDRRQGSNCWLTMGLREGKNREVKRVLEHIGLEVNRLIRLSFGPFQLLDLPEGAVSEVSTRILKDQLGEALAKEAGVDFGTEKAPTSPVEITSRPRREDRSPQRGRRRDDREVEAPAPIRERPQRGARRHVSQLRSDTEIGKGPRKRIERTQTEDRRSRTITVERLMLASPQEKHPKGAAADRARGPKRDHQSPSARGKRERIARSGGSTGDADRPRSEYGRSRAERGREGRQTGEKASRQDVGRAASDRFGKKRSTGRPDPSKARAPSSNRSERTGRDRPKPSPKGGRPSRNPPKSKL